MLLSNSPFLCLVLKSVNRAVPLNKDDCKSKESHQKKQFSYRKTVADFQKTLTVAVSIITNSCKWTGFKNMFRKHLILILRFLF